MALNNTCFNELIFLPFWYESVEMPVVLPGESVTHLTETNYSTALFTSKTHKEAKDRQICLGVNHLVDRPMRVRLMLEPSGLPRQSLLVLPLCGANTNLGHN
jgi:hypothetical protein